MFHLKLKRGFSQCKDIFKDLLGSLLLNITTFIPEFFFTIMSLCYVMMSIQVKAMCLEMCSGKRPRQPGLVQMSEL